MKARTWLASGAMLLTMAALGSAKSWDVLMHAATKAGPITLPAGDYNVKLKENQAVFVSATSGKKYTVPVKVETAAEKYDQTAVETKTENGSPVIRSINL